MGTIENNHEQFLSGAEQHPHLLKPKSAPSGEDFGGSKGLLTPNRSWSNLLAPKPISFERGKILDRRPREGWGYQNTTLEDVQDQLLNVKKNTQKTSRENTKKKKKKNTEKKKKKKKKKKK